jgi:hypothetical protein
MFFYVTVLGRTRQASTRFPVRWILKASMTLNDSEANRVHRWFNILFHHPEPFKGTPVEAVLESAEILRIQFVFHYPMLNYSS